MKPGWCCSHPSCTGSGDVEFTPPKHWERPPQLHTAKTTDTLSKPTAAGLAAFHRLLSLCASQWASGKTTGFHFRSTLLKCCYWYVDILFVGKLEIPFNVLQSCISWCATPLGSLKRFVDPSAAVTVMGPKMKVARATSSIYKGGD